MRTTKATVFAGGILATVVGMTAGCQHGYTVERAPAPTHPAPFDEALALRDWQRSTALFANGDVSAGPTNSYYNWPVGDPADSGYTARNRAAVVVEPLMSLGQLIAVPVAMIFDPPTEKRIYEGVEIGPTYTAAVSPEELQRETSQGRRNLQRAQRQQRPPAPTTRPAAG